MIGEKSTVLNSKHQWVRDLPNYVMTYSITHKCLVDVEIVQNSMEVGTIKLVKYCDGENFKILTVDENNTIYDIDEGFVQEPKRLLIYSKIFSDNLQLSSVLDISYTSGKLRKIITKGSLFCDGVLIHDDGEITV